MTRPIGFIQEGMAADARPNDIDGLPVRSSLNSFDLRWRVFSSEVEKFEWFCFDHALKLASYTFLKNEKYSYNNCVNQCPVIVIGVLCVILLS